MFYRRVFYNAALWGRGFCCNDASGRAVLPDQGHNKRSWSLIALVKWWRTFTHVRYDLISLLGYISEGAAVHFVLLSLFYRDESMFNWSIQTHRIIQLQIRHAAVGSCLQVWRGALLAGQSEDRNLTLKPIRERGRNLHLYRLPNRGRRWEEMAPRSRRTTSAGAELWPRRDPVTIELANRTSRTGNHWPLRTVC